MSYCGSKTRGDIDFGDNIMTASILMKTRLCRDDS